MSLSWKVCSRASSMLTLGGRLRGCVTSPPSQCPHRLARGADPAGRRRLLSSGLTRGKSSATSAASASGAPEHVPDRAASDAQDLQALAGSMYDELRLSSDALASLDHGSVDDKFSSGAVPDELWKVSKTCSVQEVMNADTVACGPADSIKDIVDLFSTRSGIPVVSEGNQVVGVLTRKDVMQIKKRHGSLKQRVEDHMSSPPITVPSSATAEDCAVVMLQNGVHRVPIVDAENRLVGVASRSDLFSQLTGTANESEHVKQFAGDEDLMGSRYWKELQQMKTVDMDEEDLY
mmetsp:Transcript_8685/g.22340  ORF Transcript_8685/g.22340 Transcript_8685/m.22340 type:complete len:291 (-) Transcript_8685:587-1459(-)